MINSIALHILLYFSASIALDIVILTSFEKTQANILATTSITFTAILITYIAYHTFIEKVLTKFGARHLLSFTILAASLAIGLLFQQQMPTPFINIPLLVQHNFLEVCATGEKDVSSSGVAVTVKTITSNGVDIGPGTINTNQQLAQNCGNSCYKFSPSSGPVILFYNRQKFSTDVTVDFETGPDAGIATVRLGQPSNSYPTRKNASTIKDIKVVNLYSATNGVTSITIPAPKAMNLFFKIILTFSVAATCYLATCCLLFAGENALQARPSAALESVFNRVLILTCIVFASLIQFFPHQEQIIFDGGFYLNLARNFFDVIKAGIPVHFTQRVFPSFFVYIALKVLGISMTLENVITAFKILNILAISGTAYLWMRTADIKKLHENAKVLGVCILVFNYGFSKVSAYTLGTVDTYAVFIGASLIYSYITSNRVALVASGIIGYFSWPFTFLQFVLLYIFSKNNYSAKIKQDQVSQHFILALLAGSIIFLSCIFLKNDNFYVYIESYNYSFWLSAFISSLFIVYCLNHYLQQFPTYSLPTTRKKIIASTIDVVTVAAIAVACNFILKSIQSNEISVLSNSMVLFFFSVVLSSSVTYPAVFIVAHVMYFSPVFLFFLTEYTQVLRTLFDEGLGMALNFAMLLFLLLYAETRGLSNFYFLLIFLVLTGINPLLKNKSFFLFITAITILFSRLWSSLELLPTQLDKALMPSDFPAGSSVPLLHCAPSCYFDYPYQLLVMINGQMMSPISYFAQSGIVLILLAFVLIFKLNCVRRHNVK